MRRLLFESEFDLAPCSLEIQLFQRIRPSGSLDDSRYLFLGHVSDAGAHGIRERSKSLGQKIGECSLQAFLQAFLPAFL